MSSNCRQRERISKPDPTIRTKSEHNCSSWVPQASLAQRHCETRRGEVVRDLAGPHLERLNALLRRREYVEDVHGWPLDIRLLSRAVFYVIIPPLAWVGAALVELSIETLIAQ